MGLVVWRPVEERITKNVLRRRSGEPWEHGVVPGRAAVKERKSNTGGSESEDKEPEKEIWLNVVVRFEGEGGVKKIEPLKLTKIIRAQVGEVKYARVLEDGNMLIGCNSEAQVEKAMKMNKIDKTKIIKVVRVGERRRAGCKGVIYGIPLKVNMSELVQELRKRCELIMNAKRMTKGTKKEETESVLLEFKMESLPKVVHFGFMRYSVREYIPKPMRCFKCQKFGHIAKMCKAARKCARCSGDHEYGQCGEGVRPKCCNCGGEHSVAYWGCEVMKREAEVQNIRVKEKVSYAEAAKRADPTKQMNERRIRREQDVGIMETIKEKEKSIWKEKKNLVIFIAGVINATAEVKSKTERIQVIVKAAVHHLGMAGLKWEEIHDGLSIQASQESTCVG